MPPILNPEIVAERLGADLDTVPRSQYNLMGLVIVSRWTVTRGPSFVLGMHGGRTARVSFLTLATAVIS